jgi:nitrite reductase/ring-hydroxylating ferredoxin subunit
VGTAGLAVALTACGSSDASSTSTSDAGTAAPEAAGASGAGTELAKTTDIPEGGGKIFASQSVVVTQPTAGTFKAFSSKCTHAGCAVTSVSDGTILCPCHNSKFSATDGSVQSGPAPSALPAVAITVTGDSITTA